MAETITVTLSLEEARALRAGADVLIHHDRTADGGWRFTERMAFASSAQLKLQEAESEATAPGHRLRSTEDGITCRRCGTAVLFDGPGAIGHVNDIWDRLPCFKGTEHPPLIEVADSDDFFWKAVGCAKHGKGAA